MGKKIIIGNWKMNLNMHESSLYLHKLLDILPVRRDVEVVVAPTILTLQSLSLQVNRRVVKLAAQNCYWRDHGPYTGEIPAAHLRGIADYAIIGHSERRTIFRDSEKDIRFKVQAALRSHIKPILCVGETIQERTLNETRDVLHDQLTSGLANITAEELENVIIAYEPIWAVGTGQNAQVSDVESATKTIRDHLSNMFGKKYADLARVLYGGSITIDTADSYLKVKGIDGLFVGNASLDLHQFSEIVKKAHKEN